MLMCRRSATLESHGGSGGDWLSRVRCINGDSYVPYMSSPVSAGPFLPPSVNFVDGYLKVTELKFAIQDHCVGTVRTFRQGLAADTFHGDSMIGDNIRHGDTGVFEQKEFDYILAGKPALIEKVGDEEGTGAWAIKNIVINEERSYTQNDFDDIINWDDPVIVLRSSNPRVPAWALDRFGPYRVRGYLVRVLRPESVERVPLAELVSRWPKWLRN